MNAQPENSPEEIDDDGLLPGDELEPIEDEELEFLDPADDMDGSPDSVDVVFVPQAPAEFDCQLTIQVPDLERGEVVGAIEGPLRARVEALGGELRGRRVYALFAGNAIISSAARDRVGEIVADARPLSVTVQRGYPDELVYEGAAPSLSMRATAVGDDTMRVEFETADLAPSEVVDLLKPELEGLAADAASKTFDVTFDGAIGADPGVRELLRASLRGAGASRITVDGDVVGDRALEECIVVRDSGDAECDAEICVEPTDDESATALGLSLVLPQAREQLAGKRVRVRFSGRDARPREVAELRALAASIAPDQLELGNGSQAEVLWPPLLEVVRDKSRTTLRVRPASRSQAGVLGSFAKELAEHTDAVAGRKVTIDWPAGFALDADIERTCVQELLAPQMPTSVSYTFAGEDGEPVWPAPVVFQGASDTDANLHVVDVDTENGSPVELVRAIERRLREAGHGLAGRKVDVRVVGSGAVSRTMRRTLRDALDQVGATRVRLIDHGVVKVLLPRLLSFDEMAEDEFRVTVTEAGRDDDQVREDLANEMGAREFALGAAFHLEHSAHDEAVVEALLEKGAGKIVLGDLQVYPPLFVDCERSGASLTLRAEPETAGGGLLRQIDRELPALIEKHGPLDDAIVTLVWPGASADAAPVMRVREMLVAASPAALLLDNGEGETIKLHPPELPEPELPEPELPEPEAGDELPDAELELEFHEPELPDPEPAVAALMPDLDLPDPEPPEREFGSAFDPATGETVATGSVPEPTIGALSEDMLVEPEGPAVSVIGRKDDATTPMLMIGISAAVEPSEIDAQLAGMSEQLAGRRVLVVFQRGSREVMAPKPLLRAVRAYLEPRVAALLLFVGPTGHVPAHFAVVASTLDGLAVGTKMRDPRPRGG